MQDQGQGPQPVAFTSRKMNVHELNYAAHEKETLAIMHALSKWRVYLEGRPFVVHSDHATLQHFPDQPKLSRRQARWTEKMQEYNFVIKYLPGKQNIVTDAVSRRPDLMLNSVFQVVVDGTLQHQIKESLSQDPEFGPILNTLQAKTPILLWHPLFSNITHWTLITCLSMITLGFAFPKDSFAHKSSMITTMLPLQDTKG